MEPRYKEKKAVAVVAVALLALLVECECSTIVRQSTNVRQRTHLAEDLELSNHAKRFQAKIGTVQPTGLPISLVLL
jgi:hypothetical protein